jgi:hypothetical protein
MAPPTKKQRLENDGGEKLALRTQVASIIGQLKETLESSGSVDGPELITKASCAFMKLKSLQQNVLDQMKETQAILEKQRRERDEQELKLENLRYQKELNDRSLDLCQKLESSQLLKLCCEELDDPGLESAAAFQKFLGADPNDLEQRSTIIAKLNEEVSTRSSLETELKICQHKAASLKHSLAAKRKLLLELPLKLHDVERASQPLQKFCQKSLNATRKLGSKRRTCLDLAKSLPKPLYTLYYQLQSYLDTSQSEGKSNEEVPLLEISSESSAVLLKIPIPAVADGSLKTKKFAAVHFEYDKKMGMMMAQASAAHDMAGLIGELFPGDTGEWMGENDNISPMRPYHWCNYLAGLHIAPEQHSAAKIRISTRVVVQALVRRVRATATLNWLLHSLARKPHPLPIHSTMKKHLSSANNAVRLSSWTDHSNDLGPRIGTYQAKLKRNTQTLKVDVSIDLGRYPSLPPVWKFSEVESPNSTGKGDDNDLTALYDDKLASLERRVNCDVRELVCPSDENSCEWIISHQLAEIANGWDGILEGASTDK